MLACDFNSSGFSRAPPGMGSNGPFVSKPGFPAAERQSAASRRHRLPRTLDSPAASLGMAFARAYPRGWLAAPHSREKPFPGDEPPSVLGSIPPAIPQSSPMHHSLRLDYFQAGRLTLNSHRPAPLPLISVKSAQRKYSASMLCSVEKESYARAGPGVARGQGAGATRTQGHWER